MEILIHFRQDVSTSNNVYMLGHKLKVFHVATLPPAKEKLQLCPQISQNIVYWSETINTKLFLKRELSHRIPLIMLPHGSMQTLQYNWTSCMHFCHLEWVFTEENLISAILTPIWYSSETGFIALHKNGIGKCRVCFKMVSLEKANSKLFTRNHTFCSVVLCIWWNNI